MRLFNMIDERVFGMSVQKKSQINKDLAPIHLALSYLALIVPRIFSCTILRPARQGDHWPTVIVVSFAAAQAFSIAPRRSPWASLKLMVAPEIPSSSSFC